MDAVSIGKRLRKLRGEKTISEVAKAVGVSISAVTMYENGHRIPRDEVKKRIAEYYGLSVGELFFDS